MLDFTITLKAGNSVRIIDEETLMEFEDNFLDDKVYETDIITDYCFEPLPYGKIYAIDVDASGDMEDKEDKEDEEDEDEHMFDGLFGPSI